MLKHTVVTPSPQKDRDAERRRNERKKERTKTLMLSPMWIMVLLHFFTLCKSACSPKMGITRIIGPLKTTASFRRWRPWTGAGQAHQHLSPPRAKPISSHMVGWKCVVHQGPPTMIGWTIRYLCVIWFVFHVLQFLPIRFTQQTHVTWENLQRNICSIGKCNVVYKLHWFIYFVECCGVSL